MNVRLHSCGLLALFERFAATPPARFLAAAFPKMPFFFCVGADDGSQPCTTQVLIIKLLCCSHFSRRAACESCANRSPSLMKSLEEHRPWAEANLDTPENVEYVAWQIRTTDGESDTSYKPDRHKYIFDHVPSTEVCGWYFAATDVAFGVCPGVSDGTPMPIFVSSNRCVCNAIVSSIISRHFSMVNSCGLPRP